MRTNFFPHAYLFFISLFVATQALAHEGHDDAPGENSSVSIGPISISREARKNLKIETLMIEPVTLETVLTALGQIEPIPGNAAAISSRIPGRTTALYVNDGQAVKKGQSLLEVESRQVGDPPPRVTFTAPFDGVVIDRHAVLGETVDPEKHLMEIADLREVYAEGRIYEGQVAELAVGQPVRVAVESFPKETFTGAVELLSGSLDPETRTLRVWARLQNPEGKLRPNMRATLRIVTGQVGSALAVPHQAILGDAGEKFLFVEAETDPLTFERRRVVLGTRDDRFTEVIEGVFPGDKVVTQGAYQLQYVSPTPKETKQTETK